MFAAPPNLLKVVHKLLKLNWLDRLVQPERLLDLHPHPHNQARRAQPTQGSDEEVLILLSRARNELTCWVDECEGEDGG